MSRDLASFLLIVLLGGATYAIRVAGYLVMSRFERLSPRVEAGLEAVPAAVLTALVAPVAVLGGAAETIASVATVLAAIRLPIMPTLAIAAVSVSLLRAMGL